MRTIHGQTNPGGCAAFITFCWQREFDVDSPDRRNVSTFGMDLLGIVKLELTRLREITDGLNSREEQSSKPNEPRHVLKDGAME